MEKKISSTSPEKPEKFLKRRNFGEIPLKNTHKITKNVTFEKMGKDWVVVKEVQ